MFKLRLWLAGALGVVLLAGCETYGYQTSFLGCDNSAEACYRSCDRYPDESDYRLCQDDCEVEINQCFSRAYDSYRYASYNTALVDPWYGRWGVWYPTAGYFFSVDVHNRFGHRRPYAGPRGVIRNDPYLQDRAYRQGRADQRRLERRRGLKRELKSERERRLEAERRLERERRLQRERRMKRRERRRNRRDAIDDNRPPRGDRPRGDRPRGDRPRGDRPKGDRPKGDRRKGDRRKGDRQKGDRSNKRRPKPRPGRPESRPNPLDIGGDLEERKKPKKPR